MASTYEEKELVDNIGGSGIAAEYSGYAVRASKDESGNVITTTYATKGEIPDISGKADKVLPAAEGNIASLNASGNLTDSGIPAASGSSPVSLAHTSAGYAWKGWGSGTYEVPWVIPNCLALIEGNKFDENGKLIPNYSRGEISISSTITESDMTTPSSTFPLNSEYPVFSMDMVNHSIQLTFPPQDTVSLEYYLYYKSNPQLHPQLRNNGNAVNFNTESEYYSSNWGFIYYDSTGTRKNPDCGPYNTNRWVHCLIELDRKAGKVYAYRDGTLVAQGTCESTGNVSIVILSLASYWTKTPQFAHASLWNVRLSGGATSFDPADLYRNWGIYTE